MKLSNIVKTGIVPSFLYVVQHLAHVVHYKCIHKRNNVLLRLILCQEKKNAIVKIFHERDSISTNTKLTLFYFSLHKIKVYFGIQLYKAQTQKAMCQIAIDTLWATFLRQASIQHVISQVQFCTSN